jgi:periplasmic protein TonB
MKKTILIFLLSLAYINVKAQTDSTESIISPQESNPTKTIVKADAPSIFTYVEQMPEYIGGQSEMLRYIKENLKYPEDALEEEREAKVYVKFVVDENGAINNVSSIRPAGYGFDEEAIRVVESMPEWKPGKQNGKAVKVHFQIPIYFSMPKEEAPKKEE